MPKSAARNQSAQEPTVLTVSEAAAMLRVSTRHVYLMAERGVIPSVRLGRRVLITKRAIDDLLNGGVEFDDGASAAS